MAPGWTAKVDGRPAAIELFQEAFPSVMLEAGPHEVEFNYRPRSFFAGLAISLASLVIGALFRRRLR